MARRIAGERINGFEFLGILIVVGWTIEKVEKWNNERKADTPECRKKEAWEHYQEVRKQMGLVEETNTN